MQLGRGLYRCLQGPENHSNMPKLGTETAGLECSTVSMVLILGVWHAC